MYNEQQLDFIREYGHKELTEGCIIFQDVLGEYSRFLRHWDGMYITSSSDCENCWHPDNCTNIGHHVEWHHVFAKLKEMLGNDDIVSLQFGRLQIFSRKLGTIEIECNPCLSPMSQPTLIEELLKL